MYYSAVGASHPHKHCIGAATSTDVTGPYLPLNDTLVCDLSAGGAIDPDSFHDPTSNITYLVYKVDGNSVGLGGACGNNKHPRARTPIMIQPVNSSDLITPTAGAVEILSNGKHDGPNVEGPKLFHRGGWYYLIYNNGCFVDGTYTVRYAVTRNLETPFRRVEKPLVKSGDFGGAIYGPGSADVSADGSKIIFHADTNMGWFRGKGRRVRAMFAADLEYGVEGGTLELGKFY